MMLPDGSTWSTAGLPARERFRAWAELGARAAYPVRFERDGDPDAPFSGEMRVRVLGGVRFYRVCADGHRARRGRAEVAGTREEFYCVQQFASAERVSHPRGEALLGPGAVVAHRSDLPVETASLGGTAFRAWFLPRARLDALLPAGAGPVFAVGPEAGTGALVAAMAGTLAQEADRLEPAAVDAVVDNFCRLLAIAGGLARADGLEGGREALRAAALARIERYVGEHLAEPDLTPERVAEAVGLSLRQLHRVFEPTGTSFARRVLARRLAVARAELASPAAAGRTVADVAFGWGFDNLVTFYRAFRRAYGCAPGEVRPTAFDAAAAARGPMGSTGVSVGPR